MAVGSFAVLWQQMGCRELCIRWVVSKQVQMWHRAGICPPPGGGCGLCWVKRCPYRGERLGREERTAPKGSVASIIVACPCLAPPAAKLPVMLLVWNCLLGPEVAFIASAQDLCRKFTFPVQWQTFPGLKNMQLGATVNPLMCYFMLPAQAVQATHPQPAQGWLLTAVCGSARSAIPDEIAALKDATC